MMPGNVRAEAAATDPAAAAKLIDRITDQAGPPAITGIRRWPFTWLAASLSPSRKLARPPGHVLRDSREIP
jgi:hypothetical protein